MKKYNINKIKWAGKIDRIIGIGAANDVTVASNDKNILEERLKKKYGNNI